MNEQLIQLDKNLQNLSEKITTIIRNVENIMFQRQNEAMIELEINFCCTRRKVEIFVPFNSLPFHEYFPAYPWFLKNERSVRMSKCLMRFFHPNSRLAISMISPENLPICCKSMSFKVVDLNRTIIYQENIYQGFSNTIQTLKTCQKIPPAKTTVVSYLELKWFRKYLEESQNYTKTCSIQRLAQKLIKNWYNQNLSKTTVKFIPDDYVCSITLEPMRSFINDPIVKMVMPMNHTDLISFKGPTTETLNSLRAAKWGSSFYYRRCDLQQHFNSQIYPLTNWEPWNSETELDDSGRGGKPGMREFYLKTPHNLLILIDTNYDPEHMLTRSDYTTFLMAPFRHRQRVGGIFSNTLAIGDEHGALPGHTIYLLVPILDKSQSS